MKYIVAGLALSLLVVFLFSGICCTKDEEKARKMTALAHVEMLGAAIGRFKDGAGNYPKKLQDLVPNFMNRIPKDPWDVEYIYKLNQDHEGYTLKSLGQDGKSGGEGGSEDIIKSFP